MLSELKLNQILEETELRFKHYLEDYKGTDNETHRAKINFYEDTIRAFKFILEREDLFKNGK